MLCKFCQKKIPKSKMADHLDAHMDRAYQKESYYYHLGEEIMGEWKRVQKLSPFKK